MTQTKYTIISPKSRCSKILNQKIIIIIICVVILLELWIFHILKINHTSSSYYQNDVTQSYPEYSEREQSKIELQKKCFQPVQAPNNKIILLADVLEHEIKPKPDKSIFFHVTTCATNGSVILNERQACAIESAAKWNSNRDIFVLFAAPVGFVQNEIVSPIVKSLQSYPNIQFRNLDIVKYSIGTPAEKWIKTDRIYLSKFIVSHMSDYLRFLTLYKFGGIYFDLDIIVLKNLDEMPPNFMGAESDYWIGSCVLGFESGDVGHKIIKMILRENTENYKPDEWATSAVGAASRVAHKICKSDKTSTPPEFCWGLKIYPQSAFIPIHWSKLHYLFSSDPKIMNESLAAANDSITIHAWNKLTSETKIDKSKPKTVYAALAEVNCPKVYESSGQYF